VSSHSLNRVPEAGLSALCRALAPAPVRISFAAQQSLPFRIELPSQHGLLFFHGATADAAADAALREVRAGSSALVALATEPSGAGPYVDAVREWIELVTPVAEPAEPPRPALRLVR
jgi:hypothetical protein